MYSIVEFKPKRRNAKIAKLIANGTTPAQAEKEVPKKYESIIRLTLPDGSDVVDRKLTTATSEAGAKTWAKSRELEILRKAGAPTAKKSMPLLREWWPKYMRACIGEGLADSTIALKRHCYNAWLEPLLGNLALNAITNKKRSELQHAMTLDGVGRSGMSNVMQALSASLHKAIEHEVLGSMPCVFGKIAKLKKATAGRAPFYMHGQIEALLEAADLETQAIILLGCDAGLRAGEIAGIEWPSVFFGQGELEVCRSVWYGIPAIKKQAWIEAGRPKDAKPKKEYVIKLPKHGKTRRVPMSKRLANVLRKLKLRARGSEVLLVADGNLLHRDIISDLLAVVETRAGLQAGKEGCVHVLRHTFCSRLALQGVPVHVIAELAGHHSITVTQRYMWLAPNAKSTAVAALEAAHALETPAETAGTESLSA